MARLQTQQPQPCWALAPIFSGLLAFGLLFSPSILASVPDSYGLGSRSSAMAGAVTADVSDFSAGYYNPAGLSEARGMELAVGYMFNAQRFSISGLDTEVDDVRGFVGGVVAPGKLLEVPFAFNVAVHLPDDGLSYINARRQGVPRFELYDTRAQLLFLQTGLALKPLSWLELGGGIGFLSATRGAFGIRGRADVLSPFDSQLQHEVDADLTAVRFPMGGVRFLIEHWGAIGITYRGQSNLDLQIEAILEGIVDFAGIDVPLLYELETRTIAAFTPQQVAMGLSFQRVDKLHLNLDLTWVNWSAYESPTAKVLASIDVKPPPGTPVSLPDDPLPVKAIPPRFEDRVVPRFGVEYTGVGFGAKREVHGQAVPVIELPLRLGYAFEASPVPDQPGVTNLIDADRHSFTAGVGVVLNRPGEILEGALSLDIHAGYSVFPERVYIKSNPADFVGDYSASGNIASLGTSLKVVF